eukprot:GILJ01003186.1.p1 GENE.GILJ01003186.1~~GILJ01003186.1.p1  ORF type:complete len:502 (+),score=48.27 GILJ01003186.1:46-1506(+)
MTSPTQKRLTPSDFEFISLLGEGSYARVMHARRIDTGEEFAVKIIEKKHIQKENKVHQVMMEKQVLSKLNHPNIIKLYYTFQDRHCLYFVLELMPGGELFEQIRRLGRCPLDLARFYAAEVVNILEHLHKQGIAHRDLKPENLLLSAEGHLKLADFGTAKILGDDTIARKPSVTGDDDIVEERYRRFNTFVGTAEYVSPEVLSDQDSGTAADLWALGCILYQLIAGRPPFKAESEYLTFQKILARNFVFTTSFDAHACDLIDKLLQLDPNQRLGAGEDPDHGFGALKRHPFFEGLDFDHLHQLTPPSYPHEELPKTDDETDLGALDRLSVDPDGFITLDATPTLGANFTGIAERFDILERSSWNRYLAADETIRMCGLVQKRCGLFTKKRQLILTSSPRLLYVDPEKMLLKGEIPWTDKLRPELKNAKTFYIHIPTRTYYLQDLTGNAQRWVEAILDAMDDYVEKHSDEATTRHSGAGLSLEDMDS